MIVTHPNNETMFNFIDGTVIIIWHPYTTCNIYDSYYDEDSKSAKIRDLGEFKNKDVELVMELNPEKLIDFLFLILPNKIETI